MELARLKKLNDYKMYRNEGYSRCLTVFGVVIRKSGGIVRIGGVPAQLSALGVIHGDGIL